MKTTTLLLTLLLLFYSTLSFSQAGSLDSSFNRDGKITKPEGDAKAVAIQPDGKIIAGGSNHLGSRLVRYTQTGFVDKTFGTNGIVVVDPVNNSTLNSIALTVNNEIITAGSDSKNFELAKFKPNGIPDSSFGINGKVSTNFLSNRDEAYSVVIQPNNKIIAVGTAFEQGGETSRMAVARYNPDGTLDSSFNHNGKIHRPLNDAHFDNGNSVIFQPNGKIVAIGNSYWDAKGTDITLVRFKQNGDIDTSFGTNGYTFTDFGGFDIPFGTATQSDGKIVIAGSSYSQESGKYKMIIARYTENGKLDNTFGVHGKIITTFNSTGDWANGITIQPDDKIVVAGAGGGIEIVRFKKGGSLDSSFGKNGAFIIDSTNDYESVNGLVLQKNGKIIAVGDSSAEDGYNNNYLVIRLKNDISNVNAIADNVSQNTQKDFTISSAKVYPNPVTDILHIIGVDKKSNISIYNAEGELLAAVQAINQTYNLNVKQLPAGVYYLQITYQNKKTTTVNFLKQ